jgi:hypothetical protein
MLPPLRVEVLPPPRGDPVLLPPPRQRPPDRPISAAVQTTKTAQRESSVKRERRSPFRSLHSNRCCCRYSRRSTRRPSLRGPPSRRRRLRGTAEPVVFPFEVRSCAQATRERGRPATANVTARVTNLWRVITPPRRVYGQISNAWERNRPASRMSQNPACSSFYAHGAGLRCPFQSAGRHWKETGGRAQGSRLWKGSGSC